MVRRQYKDKGKKPAEGETDHKQQETQSSELAATKSDFVKLTTRTLLALVGIAGLVSGFLASSGKPYSALWMLGLTIAFALTDLEIYWFHELGHSSELSGLWLVWTLSWALFFICGSVYSVSTEKQPNMPIALVPQRPPPKTFTFQRAPHAVSNETILSFGGLHLGANGRGPLEVNGQTPFRLHNEKGRLFCDVRIYSLGSRQTIEIKDNMVSPLPPGWDGNSNDDGMEIVNERWEPMFQLFYETPNDIKIQGIIVVPPYVWLAKGEETDTYSFMSPMLPTAIEAFKLNRLFKYPSAMFQGVPN